MTEKVQVYDVQSRQMCFVRCCLNCFSKKQIEKYLTYYKICYIIIVIVNVTHNFKEA